jgi:hypothetical protein
MIHLLLADAPLGVPPAAIEDPAQDVTAHVAVTLAGLGGFVHRIVPPWPRWYRDTVVPSALRAAWARDLWLAMARAERDRVGLVAGPGVSQLAAAIGVEPVVVLPSRTPAQPFWPAVLVDEIFDRVTRRGEPDPAIEAAARDAVSRLSVVRPTDLAAILRHATAALAVDREDLKRARRLVAKSPHALPAPRTGPRHWLDEVALHALTQIAEAPPPAARSANRVRG